MQNVDEINKGPFVNPITGQKNVEEVLTEKEARKRGYFDFDFLLRHLEDDNEFIKWFVIQGKHVIVDLEKPYLQYRKSTQINHDRILKEDSQVSQVSNSIGITACAIEDQGCISCSG